MTKEEAGICYKHKIVTPLTITSKFKKGDVLTFDEMFFAPDLFDKSKVALKTGVLLRTMLIESQDTHEDSFSISEATATKLNSKMIKVKSIKLDKEMDILDIVKVGDKVNYDTKLLTMAHKGSDDDVDIGYELTETTIDLLSEIKNKSPMAKVRGTVEKIVVFYNCEIDEMTKSLKQIVTNSNLDLSNTEGKKITGKVDGTYSINGKPLTSGFIEIKIYIETSNNMGLADKAVLANQLKCTVGHIFSDRTRTEDNQLVEGKFSRRAISARIVNSPDIIGTTSTLLKQLSKNAAEIYFNE